MFGERRAVDDMLLDVTFLIALLRSSKWAWTLPVVDGLLHTLGLTEVSREPLSGRRDFEANTGLTCSVFVDPEKRIPVKFEFPFPVPSAAGVPATDMLEQFFQLVADPLLRVLGPPPAEPFSGAVDSMRMQWFLNSSIIAVEARPGAEPSADLVALIVESGGVAEQAVSGLLRSS